MQANDIINGLFEGIGAISGWLNVIKIYKDKQVRGVYWPIAIFFTIWGFWNLYYYPSLNQWWSFWGGAIMASSNVAWTTLAIKYRKK